MYILVILAITLQKIARVLKRHCQSTHGGVRYHCDKCEDAATSASRPKRYIERKQGGVRYPCDKRREYAAIEATY